MRLSRLTARVWDAVRTRRWVVVQLTLLGGLIGGLVVLQQQPRYAAKATVVAGKPVQVGLARSPRLVAAVLRNGAARGMSPQSMLDHSRIAAVGPGTIEFKVTNPSPEHAEVLATSYARAFASLHPGQHLVVTPAVSAARIAPRPWGTIALAVVVGLIGGLALAVITEAFDRRIRSVRHVRRVLQLPLLGAPRSSTAPEEILTLLDRPYGEEAESYRILAANLDVAALDPATKVIMVTSAFDGEGRTTTAANLALAYARAGRVVALVDLNLRYPALAERFGLEGRPGVTDVVIGHVALTAAVAPFAFDVEEPEGPAMALPGRLDVLTAGPQPVDPADVIGSPAVTKLIDDLRHTHELVLLDAPPLLPVAGARVLSETADAMVVVANLSLLRESLLPELRDAVAACAAVPLGFVATGILQERRDPYAGYYLARRHVEAAA